MELRLTKNDSVDNTKKKECILKKTISKDLEKDIIVTMARFEEGEWFEESDLGGYYLKDYVIYKYMLYSIAKNGTDWFLDENDNNGFNEFKKMLKNDEGNDPAFHYLTFRYQSCRKMIVSMNKFIRDNKLKKSTDSKNYCREIINCYYDNNFNEEKVLANFKDIVKRYDDEVYDPVWEKLKLDVDVDNFKFDIGEDAWHDLFGYEDGFDLYNNATHINNMHELRLYVFNAIKNDGFVSNVGFEKYFNMFGSKAYFDAEYIQKFMRQVKKFLDVFLKEKDPKGEIYTNKHLIIKVVVDCILADTDERLEVGDWLNDTWLFSKMDNRVDYYYFCKNLVADKI